jgi:hypothetical protein
VLHLLIGWLNNLNDSNMHCEARECPLSSVLWSRIINMNDGEKGQTFFQGLPFD